MKTAIYLQRHVKSGEYIPDHDFKGIAKRIKCIDGFSLSVQASRTHYCQPRNNNGPYFTFEIGYPSQRPPETWSEYCEDWENPKDTVYAYVPIKLVVELIDLHGGRRK